MKNIFHMVFGAKKSLYDRIFFVSILGISFLTPLLFTFRLKSVFALPKLYALAIFLLVAVLSLAIKYFKEREIVLRPGKYNLLLVIYVALLFLSTLLSENVYSSLFGTYGRFIGFFTLASILILMFLAFNFLREKADQISILVAAYLSSIIVVVIGIAQHMGYLIDSSELNAVASRAFSTLGHANHFGGFIVQFIFVSFALFALFKNKFLRALILIFNLVFLYALFQTSSRGAFLAFIVSTVAVLVSVSKLFWNERKNSVKKAIIGLLICMIVGASAAFVYKEKLKKVEVVARTLETFEFIESGNVPDRLSWILSGIKMIQERPIFGFGVSTFPDVYNRFRRLDYKVPGDEQDMIVPHTAHNEYINIGATQGLLALIVYIAVVFFALKAIYGVAFSAKLRSDGYGAVLALIFLCSAVISYFVQVTVNFGTIGTMTPTFLILAVTLGHAFTLKNPDEKLILKGKAVAVALIFAIVFVSVNFYATHRMVKADRFLRLTDVLETHPDFEKEGYIYHIDALTRAVKLNPFAYNLYEELGKYYLKQGLRVAEFKKTETLLGSALAAYGNALNINNLHADTYKDIATINFYLFETYGQVGMSREVEFHKKLAFDAYEQAILLSPNNPLYRMIAADKYISLGHVERALELYEEVKAMRPEYPGIDDKISDTLSSFELEGSVE